MAEIKSFVTASRRAADRGGPIPISFVTGDVTDVEAMKTACAQAEEKFGRIQARGGGGGARRPAAAASPDSGAQTLICAAGSARTGYFRDISEGDFAWAMKLNFGGAVNAIKAVEPGMREARSGRIVIVSSALALTGYVGYSACPRPRVASRSSTPPCRCSLAGADCPTKWALRGLAEALRNELLPVGVHVHIAYPGNMDTPGFEVENRTKPSEAKAIEADETLYTPDQVVRGHLLAAPPRWEWMRRWLTLRAFQADSMLAGIRAGDFHLSCGDFGVDLLTRAMGGASPPTPSRSHSRLPTGAGEGVRG